MRLLAISDLHGDFSAAWTVVEAAQPDALLCCGDWGNPGEAELTDLEAFSRRLPVYTVYGNHDNLEAVHAWHNGDGTPALLKNGEVVKIGSLRIAGLNGIWAKSHRKPYYTTDEEVDEAALRVSASGAAIDILLSHGCPSGVADRTWQHRHGGQRCFLRAFQLIRPRVYLTGHLHRAQEHRTLDGRVVRNVGHTPRGDAVLIGATGGELEVAPFQFR